MKFRTELEIEASNNVLSHTSKVMLFGSCFAESIGEKLLYYKFPVMVNPFGILFNPNSICNSIQSICQRYYYTEKDLIHYNGLWHSFNHHGNFSNINKDLCLKKINESIDQAYTFIQEANTIIITLGTAQLWKYKTGDVVANCHKIPTSEFTQQMQTPADIRASFIYVIDQIYALNKDVHIIFTVSPVRYLKHGMHQNQISKSILLTAVNELITEYPEISYFPSYEIMMDDLRDYRFYGEDLIHPSGMAVDYIWSKFAEQYFNDDTITINKKVEAYQRALSHRILNPESDASMKFLNHLFDIRNNLTESYPFLKL
jgi:hypothetical protein